MGRPVIGGHAEDRLISALKRCSRGRLRVILVTLSPALVALHSRRPATRRRLLLKQRRHVRLKLSLVPHVAHVPRQPLSNLVALYLVQVRASLLGSSLLTKAIS